MKNRNLFTIFFFVITQSSLFTISCAKEDDTFCLSGALTKADVSDGTVCYIKLVSENAGQTPDSLYAIDACFTGGKASFSEGGIKKGTYTLSAFIDINGNAPGTASFSPDIWDFVTEFVITIDRDKQLDMDEMYWVAND